MEKYSTMTRFCLICNYVSRFVRVANFSSSCTPPHACVHIFDAFIYVFASSSSSSSSCATTVVRSLLFVCGVNGLPLCVCVFFI